VLSVCGASAVPARGTTHSAPGRFRASCGPPLRAVRGVQPLDWDRSGRVTPAHNRVRRCLRKEDRHSSALRPRPRKPGLEPRVTGESPCVRTAVGRRQASASARCAAVPAARQVGSKRLSAFRFPFFLPSVGSFGSSLFVIAGLDPAIHAEVKRGQTFGRFRKPHVSMDHRVKPGGDGGGLLRAYS